MLDFPYSSGEIKYVIIGTVINPIKAPTIGPIENCPNFFNNPSKRSPLSF